MSPRCPSGPEECAGDGFMSADYARVFTPETPCLACRGGLHGAGEPTVPEDLRPAHGESEPAHGIVDHAEQ